MTLTRGQLEEIAEILGESDSIEEVVDRMCTFLGKAIPCFDEVKFREAVNGGPLPVCDGPGEAGPASSSRHDGQGAGESLKAEAVEHSSVIAMTEPKEGDIINGWPVIFSYTTEQAVEDGVLVYVGDVGRNKVYFTSGLFAQGYEDEQKRRDLVHRGLDLLRQPDREDTPYMKLRVIEKDKIWTIAEPGKITYMMPEDY